MSAFRPSNPVARSLIQLKALPHDHPTKRRRRASHSGFTLPKVKAPPLYLTLGLSNNKAIPSNNKATHYEPFLLGSPLIPSPRKIGDSACVSPAPNLRLGSPPKIESAVEDKIQLSRFRPIIKQQFSRVHPLCRTKRKHGGAEVPETDEHSEDDESEGRADVDTKQNVRCCVSSVDLGREISMSPLARVLSTMPEI